MPLHLRVVVVGLAVFVLVSVAAYVDAQRVPEISDCSTATTQRDFEDCVDGGHEDVEARLDWIDRTAWWRRGAVAVLLITGATAAAASFLRRKVPPGG